jgi:peptidoglycan/xylan/chitin deacetylase (PgdA/CDA1 family)
VKSIKYTIYYCLFLLLVNLNVSSAKPGGHTKSPNKNAGDTVWVAKWFDDNRSAFSFSFDDGFISHFNNVRPILNQFDFKGTFYIAPLFLTDSLPGIWRYGTLPMFQSISLEGHEIGSHTLNHVYLPELKIGGINEEGTILYELYKSRQLINQKFPNQNCITFAYPFAEHSDLIDSLTSLFYESARAVDDFPNPSSLTDDQWFALNAVEIFFNEPRNSPEDDLDELSFLQNWIDSSIANEDWGILLGHEVVPYDSLAGLIADSSWNPYSNEWFTELTGWLWEKSNNKNVWVQTIANITRYIKERDNFNYNILTYDDTQIQLDINDDLDNDIYNYPLSVFIKVPDSWEFALMMQAGKIDTLRSFINETGKVIMANAIPDGGVISLFKLIISGIEIANDVVQEFELFQNYPNPFNPTTSIQYAINSRQFVTLKIYDVLGREVSTLVNEEKTRGRYKINFSALELSSGVYIYTLQVGNNHSSKKMVVTK